MYRPAFPATLGPAEHLLVVEHLVGEVELQGEVVRRDRREHLVDRASRQVLQRGPDDQVGAAEFERLRAFIALATAARDNPPA